MASTNTVAAVRDCTRSAYYVFISAVHDKKRKLHTVQPTHPSNSGGGDVHHPMRLHIFLLLLQVYPGHSLEITLVIQIKGILNDPQVFVEQKKQQ